MKKYVWVVSYLVKDKDGDVAGYRTAMQAADVIMAALQAGDFFRVTYGPDYETIITGVAIGGKANESLIGDVIDDPIAVDWPE